MKTLHPVVAAFALAANAPAADPPAMPGEPIAGKKELLFADDFEAATPAAAWHTVIPTFVVEGSVLKGTQTRDKDVPAAAGKLGVTAHAAIRGLDVPTRDSVVEARVLFDGATMLSVEFDDRKYAGSHYGHICRAVVRPAGVTIIDERDGNMRADIHAMKKDPAKKAEVARLVAGRSVTYPTKLEQGRWYALAVETAGDEMRVAIDGKPVAYLKSSGIAHATKSKIEFGVGGKDALFDDLKVWNAAPVKP